MSENNQILNLLQSKSSTKQEVFRTTFTAFKKLTKTLEKKSTELSKVMNEKDKFVEIGFHKKGDFESHINFSGDRLIFHMHTNVFDFPNNHSIQKTSYIKADSLRSFCGVIHVYNFLNDSFKYNRLNDVGLLVARIFINKDNHFLVEGENQLGFLYNDFPNQELNDDYIESIVDQSMIFALNFDLISPNYQDVSRVHVHQILDMNNSHKLRTSKSLGFKFSHENK
tara:strand:+ start:470 stop:1144 length:675 start_codon:yes stop_codon:yes gene_type:complete